MRETVLMILGNARKRGSSLLTLGLACFFLSSLFALNASAQRDADPQFLTEWDKVMKAPTPALDQWHECLTKFAAKVSVGSSEAAELIAKAAFASCLRAENLAFEGLLSASRVTSDERLKSVWKDMVPKDIWPEIRKTMRDKVIAVILVGKQKAKRP